MRDENRKRRVTIQNYHGENLVGILHDSASTSLVIVCHGFQSSKERIPMVNLAATMEKDGISAFRFDFTGNGESEGSFQYGNYNREVEDLRDILLLKKDNVFTFQNETLRDIVPCKAVSRLVFREGFQNVVQHFREEKYIITAVVGHSKGGNVVLLYASKYKDVHIVVNISGRFNLCRGMESRLGKNFIQRIKQDGFIDVKNKRGNILYRVTEESLMDRLSTITHLACLSIPQDCRVLTVHGSMDETVPAEDAVEFAKFISNHELRIIEGADHEYSSHQDELACLVLEFIKAHHDKHKDISKQTRFGKVDKHIRSRF